MALPCYILGLAWPHLLPPVPARNELTMAEQTAAPAKELAQKTEHDESLSELEIDHDEPDPATLKRILRKIDIRICLVLGVLYTASLIDRVNLPVNCHFYHLLSFLTGFTDVRAECVSEFSQKFVPSMFAI